MSAQRCGTPAPQNFSARPGPVIISCSHCPISFTSSRSGAVTRIGSRTVICNACLKMEQLYLSGATRRQ